MTDKLKWLKMMQLQQSPHIYSIHLMCLCCKWSYVAKCWWNLWGMNVKSRSIGKWMAIFPLVNAAICLWRLHSIKMYFVLQSIWTAELCLKKVISYRWKIWLKLVVKSCSLIASILDHFCLSESYECWAEKWRIEMNGLNHSVSFVRLLYLEKGDLYINRHRTHVIRMRGVNAWKRTKIIDVAFM